MKAIQTIEWTEPGEKDRFLNLVTISKDDVELRNNIIAEFGVDNMTANLAILRFRKLIIKIRSNK